MRRGIGGRECGDGSIGMLSRRLRGLWGGRVLMSGGVLA